MNQKQLLLNIPRTKMLGIALCIQQTAVNLFKKTRQSTMADLLEQIASRKFPYAEKEEKPRDWPAYNRARVRLCVRIVF
jgi:hypothetical protein